MSGSVMREERLKASAAREADQAAAERELDAILDSAIAEFEEQAEMAAQVDEAEEAALAAERLSGGRVRKRADRELEETMRASALDDMEKLVDNLNNPLFKETLEETLRALSGHSDGIQTIDDLMRHRARAAARATPNMAPEVEMDAVVQETMQGLAAESAGMAGLDTAQVEHFGEEMMTNMIAEFEKMGQKEDFDQIVENLMRQLLARDLMYEPTKLVCDKFPEWLAEKVDSLSSEEYVRYGTQYQYFQRIVAVYEREPDNFNRLTELLRDLQEYGPVPAEIIKDLAPGLEFSSEGMPIISMGQGMLPTAGIGAMAGMSGLPIPDTGATAACAVM